MIYPTGQSGAALTTYMRDTDNRLTAVLNPDGSSESHAYGADGLRRRKAVTPPVGSPIITNFDWDGQQAYQEHNESGLIVAQYASQPDNTALFGGALFDGALFDAGAIDVLE